MVLQTGGGFRSHPVASQPLTSAHPTLFFGDDDSDPGDFDDNGDDINDDNDDDNDHICWTLRSPLKLNEFNQPFSLHDNDDYQNGDGEEGDDDDCNVDDDDDFDDILTSDHGSPNPPFFSNDPNS